MNPTLTEAIDTPPAREADYPQRLAQALLETDRLYFEAGSRVESLEHGSLCWMPGLERLPAGSVCQRIDAAAIAQGESGADRWLEEVEQRLREVGTPLARLYLDADRHELDATLRARSFRPRAEFGYLFELPPAIAAETRNAKPGQVSLHLVSSAAEWEAKEKLHQVTPMGPDGYPCHPTQWVELERAKCESGDMQCYLIHEAGRICGAVGTMSHGSLVRIKNFVIHPDFRGRGVGIAAVRAVIRSAACAGAGGVGVFGIEGGAGSAVYERAGFHIATQQIEWSKPLGKFSTDIKS